MTLFLIGILEMLIVTTWTKLVTRSHVFLSGVVTMINIIIWYYVLQTIVSDIQNWKLVLFYAFGCALGTVFTTLFFKKREAQTLPPRQ